MNIILQLNRNEVEKKTLNQPSTADLGMESLEKTSSNL